MRPKPTRERIIEQGLTSWLEGAKQTGSLVLDDSTISRETIIEQWLTSLLEGAERTGRLVLDDLTISNAPYASFLLNPDAFRKKKIKTSYSFAVEKLIDALERHPDVFKNIDPLGKEACLDLSGLIITQLQLIKLINCLQNNRRSLTHVKLRLSILKPDKDAHGEIGRFLDMVLRPGLKVLQLSLIIDRELDDDNFEYDVKEQIAEKIFSRTLPDSLMDFSIDGVTIPLTKIETFCLHLPSSIKHLGLDFLSFDFNKTNTVDAMRRLITSVNLRSIRIHCKLNSRNTIKLMEILSQSCPDLQSFDFHNERGFTSASLEAFNNFIENKEFTHLGFSAKRKIRKSERVNSNMYGRIEKSEQDIQDTKDEKKKFMVQENRTLKIINPSDSLRIMHPYINGQQLVDPSKTTKPCFINLASKLAKRKHLKTHRLALPINGSVTITDLLDQIAANPEFKVGEIKFFMLSFGTLYGESKILRDSMSFFPALQRCKHLNKLELINYSYSASGMVLTTNQAMKAALIPYKKLQDYMRANYFDKSFNVSYINPYPSPICIVSDIVRKLSFQSYYPCIPLLLAQASFEEKFDQASFEEKFGIFLPPEILALIFSFCAQALPFIEHHQRRDPVKLINIKLEAMFAKMCNSVEQVYSDEHIAKQYYESRSPAGRAVLLYRHMSVRADTPSNFSRIDKPLPPTEDINALLSDSRIYPLFIFSYVFNVVFLTLSRRANQHNSSCSVISFGSSQQYPCVDDDSQFLEQCARLLKQRHETIPWKTFRLRGTKNNLSLEYLTTVGCKIAVMENRGDSERVYVGSRHDSARVYVSTSSTKKISLAIEDGNIELYQEIRELLIRILGTRNFKFYPTTKLNFEKLSKIAHNRFGNYIEEHCANKDNLIKYIKQAIGSGFIDLLISMAYNPNSYPIVDGMGLGILFPLHPEFSSQAPIQNITISYVQLTRHEGYLGLSPTSHFSKNKFPCMTQLVDQLGVCLAMKSFLGGQKKALEWFRKTVINFINLSNEYKPASQEYQRACNDVTNVLKQIQRLPSPFTKHNLIARCEQEVQQYQSSSKGLLTQQPAMFAPQPTDPHPPSKPSSGQAAAPRG